MRRLIASIVLYDRVKFVFFLGFVVFKGGVGLDASDVGIAFSEAFQDFQQTSQTLLTRVRLVVFEPALVEIFKVLLSTNTRKLRDNQYASADPES